MSDEMIRKGVEVVHEDQRITIHELSCLLPEVSKSIIQRILSEKLGYQKVCARWVLRMLIEDYKRQRVEAAHKFMNAMQAKEADFLNSTVTGDKMWVHHFTPESKRQSLESVSYTHLLLFLVKIR